jgi:ribose-phosphate pyrophosphokinase
VRREFEIIAGSGNPPLAQTVGTCLGKEVTFPVTRFGDGEAKIKIAPNLRGRDVVIFQASSPPNGDHHVTEVLLMLDAARRASAEGRTLVWTHYPYGRQDRKDEARVAVSAALLAQIYEFAGADRLLTVDLHAEQTQGATRIPWDNLFASFCLVPVLRNFLKLNNPDNLRDLVVVAPDMGDAKRAGKYAKLLGADKVAIVNKDRDPITGQSKALTLVGDIKGKVALLTDDEIAGGGTLVDAAELLIKNGASAVYAAVTHGKFLRDFERNTDALKLLSDSPVERIFVTDTILHRNEVENHPKITVVSVAPLLAEAIRRIHVGESLSKGLDSLFLDNSKSSTNIDGRQ